MDNPSQSRWSKLFKSNLNLRKSFKDHDSGNTSGNGSDNLSTTSKLLRRVASAPNTKHLFNNNSNKTNNKSSSNNNLLNVPSNNLYFNHNTSDNSISSFNNNNNVKINGINNIPNVQSDFLQQSYSQDTTNIGQSQRMGFRRTYSSNSIKTKQVQVTPNSFQKLKLLGKGDVGKVYLVREKKSSKLYAMKG